jgi:alkaline phosphatase
MPFAHANNSDSVLGALLASRFGVAFLSPNHTSDMVEVTAWGPGSERLKPQVDNIDLHTLAVDSLGLGEGKPLPGMDQKLKVKPPAKDD